MTHEDLRDQLIADGCNKNDQVDALIIASISDGITNGSDILEAVSALGYNKAHVGARLSNGAGVHHRWYKTADGSYALHNTVK